MIVPVIILLSLAIFWGVSLINVFQHKGNSVEAEDGENPLSPAFSLALLGTILMFAEALLFSYYSIRGIEDLVIGKLYDPTFTLELLGASIFALGCILHAWSVRVRGKYAVSWAMPGDHRVITNAPYNLVRHPSYLGYMLMIIGITFSWGNVVTLIPWVAIPGYYFVSLYEESMLIGKFGDEYRDYMNRVSGFIPRL